MSYFFTEEAPIAASKELKSLVDQKNSSRVSWHRQIVLVSSTLLGVLISLGDIDSVSQLFHFCMASGILLLSVGSLLTMILVYYHSVWLSRKELESYRDSLDKALQSNSPVVSYGVYLPRWCKIVEALAYISISIAFLVLGISYVVK